MRLRPAARPARDPAAPLAAQPSTFAAGPGQMLPGWPRLPREVRGVIYMCLDWFDANTLGQISAEEWCWWSDCTHAARFHLAARSAHRHRPALQARHHREALAGLHLGGLAHRLACLAVLEAVARLDSTFSNDLRVTNAAAAEVMRAMRAHRCCARTQAAGCRALAAAAARQLAPLDLDHMDLAAQETINAMVAHPSSRSVQLGGTRSLRDLLESKAAVPRCLLLRGGAMLERVLFASRGAAAVPPDQVCRALVAMLPCLVSSARGLDTAAATALACLRTAQVCDPAVAGACRLLVHLPRDSLLRCGWGAERARLLVRSVWPGGPAADEDNVCLAIRCDAMAILQKLREDGSGKVRRALQDAGADAAAAGMLESALVVRAVDRRRLQRRTRTLMDILQQRCTGWMQRVIADPSSPRGGAAEAASAERAEALLRSVIWHLRTCVITPEGVYADWMVREARRAVLELEASCDSDTVPRYAHLWHTLAIRYRWLVSAFLGSESPQRRLRYDRLARAALASR